MRISKPVLALLIFVFLTVGIVFGLPTLKKTKLSWDANTELDLASYTVYWKTGTAEYTDINSFKVIPVSPLTVPPTSVKFTTLFPLGLPTGKHFFVSTASDISTNESGFSNEVSYSFWFLNAPGNLSLQ